MRTPPKVKVPVWTDLGSEALLIVRKHLHLKFTHHKGRFDCQREEGTWVVVGVGVGV